MITQMLHVNDITLHATISGRTQPPFAGTLVLLHGFTGSAESWGGMDFGLQNWRFIAFDLLGHGQSSVSADPARYTMEACQEDLLAALRQLGMAAGEAVLLGYSLGGRIACYCAFSGFFRALILESASPGLAIEQERTARRRSDEALAERIESEGVAAFVDYWEQIPLFASQRHLPAPVWDAQRAQRLRNHPQGLANSLRGIGTGAQPSLHDRLQSLAIPVMLIVGELDSKFCDIARQMAAVLPRAELHIVPHAGHTVHLERPETFAGLVRAFCMRM